ncbi:MAG: hypothetical protein HRT62_14915 [Epibacterium sp.]|nr:hypothetical protein [Epibacterium sp.]
MTKYVLAAARPAQIEETYKVCRKAFEEGPERELDIIPEKMRGMVDHLVRDAHQLAVVTMVDGRIKGVVLGHVDSHAYCKGLVASDICLYVAPKFRGTDMAEKLVEVYASWCERIPNLVGSTLSLSRLGPTTQYMESLFRRHGYTRSGLTYIKL